MLHRHVPCHARGWGHVTAVRFWGFWGSTERGAPAISIKHVSVGGPHSAPETVYQHRRMENVGLKNLRGGRLKI